MKTIYSPCRNCTNKRPTTIFDEMPIGDEYTLCKVWHGLVTPLATHNCIVAAQYTGKCEFQNQITKRDKNGFPVIIDPYKEEAEKRSFI